MNQGRFPSALPDCATPVLRAALGYASAGLRVIPLRPKSKLPYHQGWPRHASNDPRVITPWFRSWPKSNVGIATGRGFFVLDVDPGNGGSDSFKRLTRGRSLPRTAEAMTGGGGRHYLFRVPPGVVIKNATGLRPGLDIKGDGGMIVAEPSIHPETGREYVWLIHPDQIIAEAPEWLAKVLVRAVLWIEPQVTTEDEPEPPRQRIVLGKTTDQALLLDEMVERYPVGAIGQRNDRMVQVLGSLLGRGYDVELASAVTEAWWRHFYALGVVGTPPDAAPREVEKAARAILSGPNFTPAVRRADHLANCLSIRLDDNQDRMLGENLGYLHPIAKELLGNSHPSGREDADRKGLTGIFDRLCVSANERAFVEALIVMVTYERANSKDGVIRFTDEQLHQIAASRHEGLKWYPQTIRRLKLNYISQPPKTAKRFELLVELRKGGRKKNQPIGTASEYEPTGILLLMSPDVDQADTAA
jgi:hypothetical protein